VIVDQATGWIVGVRRVLSPNYDERPAGTELGLIVVHGISLPPGEFGNGWIDRFFCNELRTDAHPFFATLEQVTVSAHVLIARDGALTQYVPFDARAWHAGQSQHCGRTACNDFSVGIELEGMDDVPYTSVQYQVLGELVAALSRSYPSLRHADVVGHSDIAPGRKTDPGPAFDWELFELELAAANAT
jgi:N-acetyl-anhydromuramoyl-L-alanine amidase